MIAESLAIIETYAFLRPLVYVIGCAVVIAIGCGIYLQRSREEKIMLRFPSKTTPRTPSGADEHAPTFSDGFVSLAAIERIEAALDAEKAAIRLGAIRRECDRANKAEKREARMRRALWAAATLAAFETMALLWVVLR